MFDIGLASGLVCGLGFSRSIGIRVVVCPAAVQMQTEQVAVGTLLRVRYCRKDLVEVVDAGADGVVVTTVSPAVVVEIGARRVHDTMQHHRVVMRIHKLVALDMKGGDCAELS